MGNHLKKIIMIMLLLFVIAALPVISRAEEQSQQKPEESKVTGEIGLSALSAYIWRGQELTRHSVVVQPAVTLSYNGFALNVWGNLDTRPYSAGEAKYASQQTETDYILSYSRKFGILQITPGYIYYALEAPYSGATDPLDSQEIFLSLGVDTILQPTLTAYKEIDHYHQWYFLLGVSHTFAFNKVVSLKLSASASYLLSTDETTYTKYDSDSLVTTDKFNNFHDGIITISLPLAVYKSLTVTPTISCVFPLSDDARYEMRARSVQGAAVPSDKDSEYIYGGVTLSYTF
jgi:hypothetical protein